MRDEKVLISGPPKSVGVLTSGRPMAANGGVPNAGISPSRPVPTPMIDERVRGALSKYPQQRPEIMRIVRAKEAVPPARQRVDFDRKGW
jgi:hypothetical protein